MVLAWTEVGGDVLQVETTLVKGKGEVTLTGKLGEVMQESARAALTCVRTRAEELGIDPKDFRRKGSAYSCSRRRDSERRTKCRHHYGNRDGFGFDQNAARHDVAMTGEITLRGKVLPIGGVKEKLLAAHRFGLKTMILSKDNEKDLADIPEEVREDLTIHAVDSIDEVLKFALEYIEDEKAIQTQQLWSADPATSGLSTALD